MIDFLNKEFINRKWPSKTIFNVIGFFVLAYMISQIDMDTKILCSLVIAFFYMKYQLSPTEDTQEKLIKSKYIDTKKDFVNNNEEIKFMLYKIKFIRQYNKRVFDLGVKHLDNFLYFIDTIINQPDNYQQSQIFDLAKTEQKETLNNFSSLVHSLPSEAGYKNDNLEPLPYDKILSDFVGNLSNITDNLLEKAATVLDMKEYTLNGKHKVEEFTELNNKFDIY